MHILAIFFMTVLTFASSAAASENSDVDLGSLIAQAQKNPEAKRALAKQLLHGKIIYISAGEGSHEAKWESTEIYVQKFHGNGRDFIPIFSDLAHFQMQTSGTPYGDKGIRISAKGFFSKLYGTETVVLNSGSKDFVVFVADELKKLIEYTPEEKRFLESGKASK